MTKDRQKKVDKEFVWKNVFQNLHQIKTNFEKKVKKIAYENTNLSNQTIKQKSSTKHASSTAEQTWGTWSNNHRTFTAEK